MVIAPAVAAPQSFYQAFAEYLTEQGMECITFDYRGTGASLSAQSPFRIQLPHWGQKDLEAVLGFALATHDSRTLPVHLVGHSIGRQISAMLAFLSQGLKNRFGREWRNGCFGRRD